MGLLAALNITNADCVMDRTIQAHKRDETDKITCPYVEPGSALIFELHSLNTEDWALRVSFNDYSYDICLGNYVLDPKGEPMPYFCEWE